MKNTYLKRVFCSCFLVILFAIANLALAYPGDMEYQMRDLDYMQGTWYDVSGREAYLFSDGNVNGNKIENLFDVAGGGGNISCKLSVIVNGNPEVWKLSFTNLSNGPSSYHQYMVIDGNTYRRAQHPRYYESVGGIYLGMSRDQVISLYGNPSLVKDYGHNTVAIGYANLGLELDVRDNIVTQITIYPYGDRAFDKSGLNANNTASEYANAYGMNRQPGDYATGIGYYEYIWYKNYPKSVTLSLYCN